VLAIVTVQLHELRKVHVQTKRFLDNLGIEMEPVRGQLDLIGETFVQVGHKCSRILDGAFTDTERRDEFGFRVHRDEYPLVADLAVAVAYLALLLLDKRPDFIALHIAALKAVQTRIQKPLAALSRKFQEAHDRVPIESDEPFCAANGAPFDKALNGADRSIFTGTHRAKRGLGLRFGKRCRAGIAAPALDSALAVGTEPLAGLVITSDAGHGISPLDFCAGKRHNEFGSGLWLTPPFGLALPTAQTGDRAVSCYLANWWRACHKRSPFSVSGPWICLGLTPANHGPFAVLPAKSFLRSQVLHHSLGFTRSKRRFGFFPRQFCIMRLLEVVASCVQRRQAAHSISQSIHAASLVDPRIGTGNAPRLHGYRGLGYLARVFHSPNSGMDGSQKIGLGRQSQCLNSVAYFSREKRFLCRPEYNSTSIRDPFYQPRKSGAPFIGLHQFVQSSDPFFLLCNFRFQLFALRRHEYKLTERISKISDVILSHSSM